MIKNFNDWKLNEDLTSSKFESVEEISNIIENYLEDELHSDDSSSIKKEDQDDGDALLTFSTDHRLGYGDAMFELFVRKDPVPDELKGSDELDLEILSILDIQDIMGGITIETARAKVQYSDNIRRYPDQEEESVDLFADIEAVSPITTEKELTDFLYEVTSHHVQWEELEEYTQNGVKVSNTYVEFDPYD
tara:strand:- start:345 stop:917 length:573 start_codon:yes stop_codon:yes gene_type:complete